MQILRSVSENNRTTFHIKTDLGLIIKVTVDNELTSKDNKLSLIKIANDMDQKLQGNVESFKA
ncbi:MULTISPECIES: hypothetical protein [Staphylococcus]|uniref:hypothetical protein n=1 Tax=Staphylococcus TaxID=1279 RepID=UPI0008A16F6F|nr:MULTISPECIES: hypothetical protein [Staphylococcus]PIS60907.1 hypothetical protein AZH47_10955 [Corynebacterium striatum]MDK7752673.1 hypothetical protein [Staphylococcus sp. UMB10092B]MDT3984810.1 hypothetical protein [Staphylococcus ureilyticus]OFQ86779.1 hypothetical protein HMPREF2913_04420 [Staphylococcus sp. HMSC065A08]OHO42153.1 hypothetical protein HMPREF2586_06860 [Staphylococcus sp. HMSC034G07]